MTVRDGPESAKAARTARKANCDLDQSTRRFNSELQQDGIDGMAE
jgi:hypothetical protein